MSTAEGPAKAEQAERGECKGEKRKGSTSEDDGTEEAPQETSCRPDQEGRPARVNRSEASRIRSKSRKLMKDYSDEFIMSTRLSRLRKEEEEVGRKRKSLFEAYSQLTSDENCLMEQIYEIGKEKKALALNLCGLEEKITNVNREMVTTEVKLGVTRERIKQCQTSMTTAAESRCIALEKESELLKDNLNFVQHNLEQAVEKLTCQICMENTRNAVILPCMHFLYCSGCLHNHQKMSKVCPTCRGSISAVLNCNLNIE